MPAVGDTSVKYLHKLWGLESITLTIRNVIPKG